MTAPVKTIEVLHTDDCPALLIDGTPVHYCCGTWQCSRCERRFGYCQGTIDDMPDLCDECWLLIDSAPWSTTESQESRP